MTSKCAYNLGNGETCKHPVEADSLNNQGFCIFHQNIRTADSQKRFWWRLKRLDLKDDGDWRGFNFPGPIDFEKVHCKSSLTLKNAKLHSVKISQGVFEKTVDLTGSGVQNLELQTCKFEDSLTLKGVTFGFFKAASIEVQGALIASESKFDGEFFISGVIKKLANFNRCHFSGKATFIQTKTITIKGATAISFSIAGGSLAITVNPGPDSTLWKKVLYRYRNYKAIIKSKVRNYAQKTWGKLKELKRRVHGNIRNKVNSYRIRFPYRRENVVVYVLFDGRAMLDEMSFTEPKKVTFNGVRLSEASFSKTDLRGVNFIGNDWSQKKLGRNGLYEEVVYNQNNDYYGKREMLPGIENTYRNIRYSLEESKDFGLANDFFVGEMEAKRRQLKWWRRWLLSVPAIYRAFSNYGTSPARVFLWLVIFTVLHAYMIWDYSIYKSEVFVVFNHIDTSKVGVMSPVKSFEVLTDSLSFNIETVRGLLTYAIQTLTLQKDKVEIFGKLPESSPVYLINTLYGVLGPIIIALFAVSVRTRIKRN